MQAESAYVADAPAIPDELRAQFQQLQMETAGLTDVTDPVIYAKIEDTRSQVEDLALPVDTSYQNFESGQQVANPTEDFPVNSLVVTEAQDSTRQRISSLDVLDFPSGYSGS